MNIASLFNLAGPDLMIIMVIVLLLFGAKRLPELARGLGQAVREFSKAKDEFEREVTRPPEPAPVQRLEQPPVAPPPAAAAVPFTPAVVQSSEPSAPAPSVDHDPHGDQTQGTPHEHVS
jgi:sec-independent protein translocase protein TatA